MANEAIRVKALDLSYVMQHALLAGQMGIRWENYDPTECSAYHRLTALQARCDKLEAAAREVCEKSDPHNRNTSRVYTDKLNALRKALEVGA